jgi:hypothetical protein
MRTFSKSLILLAIILLIPAMAHAVVYNPTPIMTSIGKNVTFGQVTAGDTATLIKAVPEAGVRYSIIITNTSTTDTIYIGATSSITPTTNSYPLAPGKDLTLDKSFPTLYGICESGKTVKIGYIEEVK